MTDCDGTCQNLHTDPQSCGACGTTCAADQVCASGACAATCPAGTTACHGSCVDLSDDVANCGACGTVCSTAGGAATCAAGACGFAACSAGSYGQEGGCHACTAIAGCATESCTTAFDATCAACAPGRYLSGNSCVTCSGACAAGSYETAACSATADRTCGACAAIAGCTTITCTTATDSTCAACPSGSYLDENDCRACSTGACPAGTYETGACSATADRTCGACTAIPGCTDEVCTTGTDATCQACAPGSYLSGNACVACSTDACPTGSYETTACSATADRTCGCAAIANCTAETCSTATDQTCTACGAGHYVSGGACATCSTCRPGEFTETACGDASDTTCAALDCYTLHVANPTLPDGVYHVDPDGAGGAAPFDAYCDMTSAGGGWTLVMKVDGSLPTFTYASSLWTNAATYQPDAVAYDTISETKSAAFATMPFNAIRVGMYDHTDSTARWLDLPRADQSLLELFTSGYQPLDRGRAAWKSLLASPSLQYNCNEEGFNIETWTSVRIGILGNQENDCGSTDSRIGIGGGGGNCGQDPDHAAGNEARCDSDQGDRSTPAFSYVMVRDCPGGVCECGTSLLSCDALCVDTGADPRNCGSCGSVCGPQANASGACVAGSCGLTCNAGWDDCDHTLSTGCETDLSWDAANCGACGNACSTGLSCIAGACIDATSLQIENPNHRVVEYLPRNPHSRTNPAEGTCNGDCTVHPTVGWFGVRIRSSAGFASGCNDIERGDCYVQLPAHVVIN